MVTFWEKKSNTLLNLTVLDQENFLLFSLPAIDLLRRLINEEIISLWNSMFKCISGLKIVKRRLKFTSMLKRPKDYYAVKS